MPGAEHDAMQCGLLCREPVCHLLSARQVLTSPQVRAMGDCRMSSVLDRLATLLYSDPAMAALAVCQGCDAPVVSLWAGEY